jgi:hypothetical protein
MSTILNNLLKRGRETKEKKGNKLNGWKFELTSNNVMYIRNMNF